MGSISCRLVTLVNYPELLKTLLIMGDSKPLPPGWDMKFDARTGKYYYINHYTKTTSWEDPRERYQQIGKPTGKDNKENNAEPPTVQASSSMVPLTNQQVVTMRRELEAENLSSQSQVRNVFHIVLSKHTQISHIEHTDVYITYYGLSWWESKQSQCGES